MGPLTRLVTGAQQRGKMASLLKSSSSPRPLHPYQARPASMLRSVSAQAKKMPEAVKLHNRATKAADLSVQYGDASVVDNLKMTQAQTSHTPTVKIQGDDSAFYTMLMVDPDAPSAKNPVRADWLHWLVTNAPGGDLSAGSQVMTYNGPSPPAGSGPHRYIFLVFQQPQGKIKVSPPSARNNFHTADFVKSHQLGDPVAALLYTVEND